MTDGERGATDVFRLLADEIRVDILCAIATLQYEHGDAGAGAIELSFSDIYDHVDVDNTSKLSYHLGELSGVYLRKTDEGYSLSHAGERIARFILSENYGQPRTFGPVPVDGTCIFCGEESLEASLFHQFFGVECTACGEQVAGQPITPAQVRTRDEAEIVRSVKLQCVEVYRQIRRGLCPECGGQLSAAIADLTDGPLPEADPYLVTSECEECLRAYNCPLTYSVAYHPASISFHWDRGVDVTKMGIWEFHEHVYAGRWTSERVAEYPVEYQVTMQDDQGELRFKLASDASVTDVEQVIRGRGD